MAEGVPELTIPQLLDQPWMKRAGRVAAIALTLLCSVIAGGGVAYFTSLGNRVTAIEQDRSRRALISDIASADLKGKVTNMQLDLNTLNDKIERVVGDTTLMRGILQEMQRSKSAALFTSPLPLELQR